MMLLSTTHTRDFGLLGTNAKKHMQSRFYTFGAISLTTAVLFGNSYESNNNIRLVVCKRTLHVHLLVLLSAFLLPCLNSISTKMYEFP